VAGTPDNGPTGSVSLRVSTQLSDVRPDDKPPELSAYAFSPGGALLQSAELDNGEAELKLIQRKEDQAVRVVVGPRVDTERKDVLAELFRLSAAEKFLRIEGGASEAKLDLVIQRPDWLCWILGLCVVRGTLLKRNTPGGGLTIDLPVCDAEVEVYEVDPFPIIIAKIPDDLLDRLRKIVGQRKVPPFPPDPGPIKVHVGPGPDPAIQELLQAARAFGAAPSAKSASELPADVITRTELAQLAEERFAQQRVADAGEKAAGDERAPVAEAAVRTLELGVAAAPETDEETMAANLDALAGSPELRLAANQSLEAFRASLISQQELVRPIFCWLFPIFVTTRLVATAETDDCGHFSTIFSTGCSSDIPDLYFIAYRRLFFGIRIPIYKPLPIPCYTYWNYACGTEVTLITTSPFALTCPPCGPTIADPRWVNVISIGHTSLAAIYGSSQTLTDPTKVGLTGGEAPFGGLLRLNLDFDNALRDDLNVMYYRVSWKKAGLGGDWIPLETECHRHWTHVVNNLPVVEVYSLGPHVVNGNHGLFEIPPALPPGGPNSKWSPIDGVEDTTNAKFPTGGSQPAVYGLVPPGQEGIYKLRVELFDNLGNPVNINALGIHFVVPNTPDLSGTIPTIEAASLGLVPGLPVGDGNSFIMRLHIDNNPTTAQIHPAVLNGSVTADANCGLIRYTNNPATDTVEIAYTASHPHGFADYTFDFRRGTTPKPPSASGQATGTFSTTLTVAALLETCEIAAFAEDLHVRGRATDGWSRLGYDAHDLAAFVLAPPKEAP
jgi:hypothetical protein